MKLAPKLLFDERVRSLWRGLRHPEVPLHSKLVFVLAIVYVFSPLDVVPDVIPLAGWLDDLIAGPLLVQLAYATLPATIKAQLAAEVLARKAARRVWLLRLLLWVVVWISLVVVGWWLWQR